MLVFPEPSGGPLLHSHCDPSNSGELQELIVKGWRMFLIQIVAVIGCHYVIDAFVLQDCSFVRQSRPVLRNV
jgi:hypothetical protein